MILVVKDVFYRENKSTCSSQLCARIHRRPFPHQHGAGAEPELNWLANVLNPMIFFFNNQSPKKSYLPSVKAVEVLVHNIEHVNHSRLSYSQQVSKSVYFLMEMSETGSRLGTSTLS